MIVSPVCLLTKVMFAVQADFIKQMEGIVCDTHENVIDEAPGAYKDLTTVMANQEDMVDVEHRLLPLLNVKGFETGPMKGWKGGKKGKKQRA